MIASGVAADRHRLLMPVLRVPIVDRTLYAATSLALVHVTVQTFRDSAAQISHYPTWLVIATRILLVVLALWVAASTIRGIGGVIRLTSLQVLVVMAVVVGALSTVTATDLAHQPGMPWQLHLLVISSCVAVLAFGMFGGMLAVVMIWVEFFLLKSPRGWIQAASEAGAFLAGGIFCGALIYVVRRGAELVEQADRDNERVREATTLLEHRQAASEWWNRFIHDTVLGAFLLASRSAPGDTHSRASAAEMARDAIDALHGRRPPSGNGTPDAVLRTHAASLGLEVTGDVRDSGAPPLVRDEVVGAAKEAITNVARHAGTTKVIITAQMSPDSANLWISDEGRGFDPTLVAGRLGVRDSLERRMIVLGGDAKVESTPGEGTSVHISWHRARMDRSGITWPQEPYAALGIPLFLYCALHAAAGVLFGHTTNTTVLAVGAVVLVVVVTGCVAKRLPDHVVVPVVAMLPLLVALLTTIIEPMRVPDFRTWFVGACVPIFIGLVLRGRRRLAFGISLATMMSFMVVGAWAGTVPLPLAINVSAQQPLLTLGAIAISLTLDRSADHIVRLGRETSEAAAAIETLRARELERRSRLDELASDVEPLLRRLASGAPTNEQDRTAYREVEAHVRDGLTGRAVLSGVVRRAVAQARARGANAVVSSEDGSALPHVLWPIINDIVVRCANTCDQDSTLTIRLTGTPDRGQCTVAVADPVRQAIASAIPRSPQAVVIEESLQEDSLLVTMRWPD